TGGDGRRRWRTFGEGTSDRYDAWRLNFKASCVYRVGLRYCVIVPPRNLAHSMCDWGERAMFRNVLTAAAALSLFIGTAVGAAPYRDTKGKFVKWPTPKKAPAP